MKRMRLKKIQTEIVLGCIEETTQLHEAVANFNNRNDEITIVIHNYYKEDKTERLIAYIMMS